MSDGLYNICKVCRKECYKKNLVQRKKYYLENRDRIKAYELIIHDRIIARKKIYFNKRFKTDIIFRLIRRTRSRIRHALSGKSKSIST